MFRSTARLDRLFPLLARHGLTITDSCNVLRFLGKIAPAAALPRRVSDGIRGDRQRRYEGIRLKHSCGRNSVKTYNKAGNVLRVETTINDPRSFKVYRRANDDPSQPLRWQNMRKGVADMQRRASLSQRSNDRYFDALASCKTDTTLLEAIEQICKKTQSHGRCVRAINPWSPADFSLLRFLAQGQWCIEGLRNRDLARWLEPDLSRLSKADRGRLSARVSRILGILKTHGLIRKVPKSHRYTITPKGSQICSMVITASTLDGQDLTEAAA
jgi:hypothetical protein